MRGADLFAGAGGSSLGMRLAGVEVVLAVENNPSASATYAANHPRTLLLDTDIRLLDPAAVAASVGEIQVLTACPPCQGWSTLGTSDPADERNGLVPIVLRFIQAFAPDAFILENVPGLGNDQRLHDLLTDARRMGYGVRVYPVDAVQVGVPQRRRRLIVVGIWGVNEARLPDSLWNALPSWFPRVPRTVRSAFRNPPVAQGWLDPLQRHRKASPVVARRLAAIPAGGGRHDLPDDLQLECHRRLGHRGAGSVYGRMRWSEPAPTMTTRCTTPSCGRFAHPDENRGITLREAARLQTFPDWYQFEGNYGDIEAQIGNAVPVRLAQAVTFAVLNLLVDSGDVLVQLSESISDGVAFGFL